MLAARLLYDNAEACTTTPVLQLGDNGAMFRFEVVSGPGQAYGTTTNPATITVTTPPVLTATTLASRSSAGVTANNRSYQPSISADGALVAFISDATNLVPGFIGSPFTAGNVTPAGAQSGSRANGLKLAAGGRYAIFSSLAGDLVADDTNGSQDVFVRDLQNGTPRRVSLRADGAEFPPSGNGQSDMHLDISADGRFIIFMSNQDFIGDDPSGAYSLYFSIRITSPSRAATPMALAMVTASIRKFPTTAMCFS